MISARFCTDTRELETALAIRQAAGCGPRDLHDDAAWVALAQLDGQAVATGRLWRDGAAWRIGKVCVLPEERGKGLGDLVFRMLLNKSCTAGGRIALEEEGLKAAYLQSFGFTADVSGEYTLLAENVRFPSRCHGA